MNSCPWKLAVFLTAILFICAEIECGGSTTPKTNPPSPQQKLVDPSGNWKMSFTDASGNTFVLSALFNQVGSTVNSLDIFEVGNGRVQARPRPLPAKHSRILCSAMA